jgi:sulfotransferase
MPGKTIYFNSSLPRSGSTLMQNILAQNPRVYCSPTSGVVGALGMARMQYQDHETFKAQDRELVGKAQKGFMRGALLGHYEAITDRPVCVDKSRIWLLYHEWLASFWPNPKVVVCIRDIRAILSSMEKLYRKSRERGPGPNENLGPGMLNMIGVTNRVGTWMNSNPVGLGVSALIDAMQKGTLRHCHVVRYEDLTRQPRQTMVKVYEYLGLPYHEHDFNDVEQVTREDDAHYSITDHTIRRKVEPVPADYKQLLGEELCAHIVSSFPLFYRTFYPEVR